MIDAEAGQNTGQLRIKGIIGLTTTVIGVVQEGLAMVLMPWRRASATAITLSDSARLQPTI